MSAKNNATRGALPERRFPYSLRLRLVLWYSGLATVALFAFIALFWSVTQNVLMQSVASTLHAETRVTSLQIKNELLSSPPYWPSSIVLPVLDTYKEPGIVIEIIDTHGKTRYSSGKSQDTRIPFLPNEQAAVLKNQTQDYQATINGQAVQVSATSLYASSTDNGGSTVIGTILVAKSLEDINSNLLLTRTLMLSIGGIILLLTLIGGWIIAVNVLSPLSDLARTAQSIAAGTEHGTRVGNLSQRVNAPGGRDEMTQVIDAFNEMLMNLERATQSQHRFVADASHELRAPLTIIQGNLTMLQRRNDDISSEERHLMLSDAHAETLRLARLVDELLLLARADASMDSPIGEKQQAYGEQSKDQLVELDHVTLQLARQLRGHLQEDKTNIQLSVGSIEPIRVHGNEENIRRVLLILLDNAIKYSSQEQQGKVTISLRRERNEAFVCIQDNGIGISKQDLPHIFERFFRADQVRSRQGTGLGLSIAQTLIKQIHGEIIAESMPNKGSTFIVRLPIALPTEHVSQV